MTRRERIGFIEMLRKEKEAERQEYEKIKKK